LKPFTLLLLLLPLFFSGCSLWPLSDQSGQMQPSATNAQQHVGNNQQPLYLTVDPKRARSRQNFHHIQAALDAIPQFIPSNQSSARWTLIRIAPGLYRERLFIQHDKVVLAGSGLDTTMLQYPILRSAFLQSRPATAPPAKPAQMVLPRGSALSADWGAAVVNIAASDVALLDITVHNSFALENPTHPQRFDHQFAIRGFEKASRIITDRSVFATNGADTASLWNKSDGLYYHSRSYFSGRVDLFCPRGSALVVDSDFVNLKATATLWHDGELDPSAKLVVLRSSFHGVTGFELGRRHYDGQFVLLGNHYSEAMADRPIYRVTYPSDPVRDQANRYGERHWFYQSQGPAYSWLQDKWPTHGELAGIAAASLLESAEPSRLLFGDKWQPEQQLVQIRQWLAQWPPAHQQPSDLFSH